MVPISFAHRISTRASTRGSGLGVMHERELTDESDFPWIVAVYPTLIGIANALRVADHHNQHLCS
jgi:hypothetical protein